MAKRKNGSIASTIQTVAALALTAVRSKKNSGTPIATAAPKQTICRPVNPNSTLALIFARSL